VRADSNAVRADASAVRADGSRRVLRLRGWPDSLAVSRHLQTVFKGA